MMPRLSWLQLDLWVSPFGPFLDKLVVPNLREINFSGKEQWCKSELLSLIHRSSSPLETLNISHSAEIVRADINACFENIRTLREISVTSPPSCITRNYCRGVDQQGSELQIVVDEKGGALT
jgi:hypothetical protein